MFMTFQEDPNLGCEHNEAMEMRLNKYYLKSLLTVVQGANHCLMRHAMDCILWVSLQAGESRSVQPNERLDSEKKVFTGGLPADEIAKIMMTTLTTITRVAPAGSNS